MLPKLPVCLKIIPPFMLICDIISDKLNDWFLKLQIYCIKLPIFGLIREDLNAQYCVFIKLLRFSRGDHLSRFIDFLKLSIQYNIIIKNLYFIGTIIILLWLPRCCRFCSGPNILSSLCVGLIEYHLAELLHFLQT